MRKLTLVIAILFGIVLFIFYLWLYGPYYFGVFVLLLLPAFKSVIWKFEKNKRMQYYVLLAIVFIVFLTLLILFPSLNYFINKYQTVS